MVSVSFLHNPTWNVLIRVYHKEKNRSQVRAFGAKGTIAKFVSTLNPMILRMLDLT